MGIDEFLELPYSDHAVNRVFEAPSVYEDLGFSKSSSIQAFARRIGSFDSARQWQVLIGFEVRAKAGLESAGSGVSTPRNLLRRSLPAFNR